MGVSDWSILSDANVSDWLKLSDAWYVIFYESIIASPPPGQWMDFWREMGEGMASE